MSAENAAPGRRISWDVLRESADVRRLLACVASALGVDLMTGPSGSVTSPTSGLSG